MFETLIGEGWYGLKFGFSLPAPVPLGEGSMWPLQPEAATAPLVETPQSTTGRDRPERVVATRRNGWSQSIGMSGRDQSESLVAISRCAQRWMR
jgi:hypothetical protein